MRTNDLTGQFMNPPEKKFYSKPNNFSSDDIYFVTSLRKTSEEIRNKNTIEKSSMSESKLLDKQGEKSKRKDSDNIYIKDDKGELIREPTIYDYEKCANIISIEIEKAKSNFDDWFSMQSNKSNMQKPCIGIFNEGIYNKNIQQIL